LELIFFGIKMAANRAAIFIDSLSCLFAPLRKSPTNFSHRAERKSNCRSIACGDVDYKISIHARAV
jgi:hypothetical protein